VALLVDIKKRLGAFSLEANFAADKETLAILGASGCGKSLALRCVAGIETPDEGHIELDGKVFYDSQKKVNLPPQKRKVGYLFQDYALFPNMTVAENIASGLRPGQNREKIVNGKIEAFCLSGLENHYPRQLSGGQKQRTALARLIVAEPDIIMLDEPFSALDSYLKWQMEQEMRSVLEEYGRTALFVSHDRDEVFRLCQRIALISEGKMEKVASKHELFQNPQTLAGALLTGCKNISRARRLNGHRLLALDWDIELTAKGEVPANIRYVGVRAHYLQNAPAPAGENVLPCRIQRVVETAFDFMVVVKNRQSTSTGAFSQLVWQVDKEYWRLFAEKLSGFDTFSLYFAPESLLLLH
jgi:molybdate transport system ATP-binding protein